MVTRKQCMDRIWRDRTKGDSRTLDTHVKRLRKKIELTPAEPSTSSPCGGSATASSRRGLPGSGFATALPHWPSVVSGRTPRA